MVGDSISGQSGSPPVALTASQWLQFDVYGFVLIDDVLTDEEIRRMKDALYRLKTEPDLDALGVYVNQRNDHLFHVGHVLEYDPALLEYAAHPRLTALAGEVVGGKVRVEETEAIINSRDPAMAWRRRLPKDGADRVPHGGAPRLGYLLRKPPLPLPVREDPGLPH